MTAALLRPELPVLARTVSSTVAERMRAFGRPTVINPFDRFGDYLCLGFRAPASYQLMTWLTGAPGSALPARHEPPERGRWVVCGYGRFGREVTAYLRGEGLEVSIVDPRATATDDPWVVAGDGFEADVLERAGTSRAVAFVAGTDNDTTNLSLVVAARRLNPGLFVTARRNTPASAPLFDALAVDNVMTQTEVVAREALSRLANPLLWRFLQGVPGQGDQWARQLVDRLTAQCGRRLPTLWQVRLTPDDAPALTAWLETGDARLGDLMRDPEDRDRRIAAVPLMVLRAGECLLGPADDDVLETGDALLLAGRPSAHRALEATQFIASAGEYVTSGRHVPSSWVLRRLSRTPG
jgi:Trk K+ transport system NAD-binding subunit